MDKEGRYSVVVEEEDFDAGRAIDNLGDVALHCLHNIHPQSNADSLATKAWSLDFTGGFPFRPRHTGKDHARGGHI